MSRSIWKKPVFNLNCLYNKKNIYVWSKNTLILNTMIGLTYFVYSGKQFKRIFVSRKMVGFIFGEFVRTRKFGKPKSIKKTKRLKK